MREVLIVTEVGDLHAAAVQWALAQSGRAVCRRWLPMQLDRYPASMLVSGRAAELLLTGPDGPIDLSSVDRIWVRRATPPPFPPSIPAEDQVVARRELESFLHGVLHTLGDAVHWINRPAARRPASLKMRQLAIARGVGLSVPRTLVTNDAARARAFIAAARGRAVYKGFHPAFWKVGSTYRYWLNTTLVEDGHLAGNDEALRFCPGIFQEYVAKRSELRITVFGDRCIAAEIRGQDEIDWRIRQSDIRCAPYALPAEIEGKLARLMAELGLEMATIDMIVTPDGEHVFLEVNEQGQFLFVEGKNPEIRLLSRFTAYLAGDGRDADGPGLADYMASDAWRAFRDTELPQLDALPGPFDVAEPARAG